MNKKRSLFLHLAREIEAMANNDQIARLKGVEFVKKHGMKAPLPSHISELITKIDRENNNTIYSILGTYGWPSELTVGKEAAHLFWLLVQHQDNDVVLQKKALALLETEVSKGLQLQDFAYLTDRINKNEDKPQIYGTQWEEGKDRKFRLYQVFDRDNLDFRRNQIGLETFEESKQAMMQALNLTEHDFEIS